MKDALKSQHYYGERINLSGNHSNNIGFFVWLRHPYKGLPYLLGSILFMLISSICLFHYYLSNYNYNFIAERPKFSSQQDHLIIAGGSIRKLEKFGDIHANSEMVLRIDELKNIRDSVNKELLMLEKKRQQLLMEITNYNINLENLKLAHENENQEIEKVRLNLNNLKLEFEDMKKSNQPNIEAPLKIIPVLAVNENEETYDYKSSQRNYFENSDRMPSSCTMSTCFDYSRCSVFSQFPAYLYNISDFKTLYEKKLFTGFYSSRYLTSNPKMACVYIYIVSLKYSDLNKLLFENVSSLPFWGKKHGSMGTNHMIINLNYMPIPNLKGNNITLSTNKIKQVSSLLGRSLLVQSSFTRQAYRKGFDIVLPDVESIFSLENKSLLPMMVPVRRKYMITFHGDLSYLASSNDYEGVSESLQNDGGVDSMLKLQFTSHQVLEKVLNTLNAIQIDFQNDGFLFNFVCKKGKEAIFDENTGDIPLCGTQSHRLIQLQESTFTLILMEDHLISKINFFVSTRNFQIRLLESLRSGAIPVILGIRGEIVLPFEDIIDWHGATLWIPVPRVTELHFIIRSISDSDILEMRRRGRLIYETYFSSLSAFVESLLSLLRLRLQIPALPVTDTPSQNYFNKTFPVFEQLPSDSPDTEEVLGPLEPPLDSSAFQRNFTSLFLKLHPFENLIDMFNLYPYNPFSPVLSGDAKFLGSSYGFRTLGDGVGGSGKEFKEALGGDFPREQFTILILTYEREAVLISAVSRFKGLPHLNKVVIVWNSNNPPNPDLKWPDIGVKIEAIKASKNSLNNRFLPYKAVKTEAVLSIDDDVHLRHDEIIFAFRVWRQARDRIVGFPGRFVSFYKDTSSFFYNSNYTCEMSMVLTGAAFIHKYYMYVYSYIMPKAIRNKVDEFLNCEDIAMNFLVSHITRKPPIKVTSRWTFKCPGCPNTLYSKDTHFDERHQCISFFTKVYGYLPLLTTQHRADSILFKTRIPHDKQKCFKYI